MTTARFRYILFWKVWQSGASGREAVFYNQLFGKFMPCRIVLFDSIITSDVWWSIIFIYFSKAVFSTGSFKIQNSKYWIHIRPWACECENVPKIWYVLVDFFVSNGNRLIGRWTEIVWSEDAVLMEQNHWYIFTVHGKCEKRKDFFSRKFLNLEFKEILQNYQW